MSGSRTISPVAGQPSGDKCGRPRAAALGTASSGAETLVAVLRARADELGERIAYVELGPEGEERGRWTYGDIDRAARRIATTLDVAPGTRALLLYPHGVEFVTAFFGCLYAGVVAVPAYPPRNVRGLPRVRSIVDDASPGLVLTTEALLARHQAWLDRAPELAALPSQATDGAAAGGDPDDWREPALDGDSPAFLQYTSGSTSTPKGVRVLHRNLVHNQEMIRRAFDQSRGSVIVSWLPLYHDMGLIGGVLQPLYAGARCLLMSPGAFLQKPSRWLRAISEHRATTSGGPNFAYDLCVEKVPAEEVAELDLSCWRVAFNGAEPVRAETLDRFARAFASAGFGRRAFHPCYGLAEATLFVTGGRVGEEPSTLTVDGDELKSAGRAVAAPEGPRLVASGGAWLGQEVQVVDPEARLALPDGRVGEIWVHGPSVADGYWRREEETARAFRARLADDVERGPYLRTGDLGFLRDGELFVTGRLKDLVILHGRNHYPQDLERSAGAAHPALREGAAAAFIDAGAGVDRLVVVQEAEPRRQGEREELGAAAVAARQAVAMENEIAVHEVLVVAAGQVPRTSSGKIRRSACQAAYREGGLRVLARSGGAEDATDAAAEPAVEIAPKVLRRGSGGDPVQRLELMRDRLRREIARHAGARPEAIDLAEPLPALGIDSLAVIELGHFLERVTGKPVDPIALLGAPSAEALLRELRAVDDGRDPAERAGESPAEGAPEPSPSRPGPMRLTTRHRALLFQEELPGAGSLHHLVGLARLRGRLDEEAFERAVAALVVRHPSLGARLDRSGEEPVLQPPDSAEAAGLSALRFLPGGEAEPALVRHLEEEAHRPFDLAREAPLRLRVAPVAPDERLVLLVVHHLVSDFWSVARMVEELGGLYRAERADPGSTLEEAAGRSDWDELTSRFEREERRLDGLEGAALRAHWAQRFAGPPEPLDLPISGVRPAVRTGATGSTHRRLRGIDPDALRTVAGRRGVTPSAWLLAAFQALLVRHGGPEAPVVAVPTAGRSGGASRHLVGYLVQVVPVTGDLSDDPSFGDLAERTGRELLEAVRHADYPLARIVTDAGLARVSSRPALAQALFSYQSSPAGTLPGLEAFALGLPGGRFDLDGLEVESLPVERWASAFDLELEAAPVGDRLAVRLVWDVALFDPGTAERLLARFEELLAHATRRPDTPVSRLPLLTERERATVLSEWSETGCDDPREAVGGVPARVWEQIARTPDAVAVTAPEGQRSYRALGERAEGIARRLRSRGVGPEVLVGVLLDRSTDLLAALLATWRAGGAYVPLDPTYPAERLATMIADAGLRCLVTTSELAPRMSDDGLERVLLDRPPPPQAPAGRPDHGVCGDGPLPLGEQLAYVIYTSGSTGRPKGVQISHRALANFVRAMERRPGLAAGETLLAVTTVSFDISVLELFLPLVRGARIALLPRGEGRDPEALAGAIDRLSVGVMQATPATWKLLLAAGGERRPGLRILCGGEALPPSLASRLHAAGAEVWNLYGPTETTVWSSRCRLEPTDDRVTAGLPIEETRIVVLDRHLEPAPPGVPGEIWIGGTGTARGYRSRPVLTAERFVPDPFDRRGGGRLYRTGDLGRWTGEGRIEILGRIDHQVKVRGFRVEPGEIEEALRAHPSVREAVVVARGESGEARLVAFLVAAPDAAIEPAELRRVLGRRLPAHMVPAAFVELRELPLTPNRKVDRKRLPDVSPSPEPAAGDPGDRPGTPVEEVLTVLWAEALGVAGVSPDADFFALGGHSLDAARLVHRARAALDRELPLHLLLEHPTPRALAARLAADPAAPDAVAPAIPELGAAELAEGVPLSFAQERVWLFQRLHPDSPAYNLPVAIDLRGPLPVADLERAFEALGRRHQALRATLDAEEPVQRAASTPRLARVDLAALPEPARRSAARAVEAALAARPFVPGPERPLRAVLLAIGEREHRLVVVAHHSVADGGSMALFPRDLVELTAAEAPGGAAELADVARGLLDFAAWQRSFWSAERLRDAAASAPAAGALLELPTDRPRPPAPRFRGAVEETVLDAGTRERLEALCRRGSTTPFMVLLAAFQLFLGRLSGTRRVTVGSPFENRDRIALREAVGFFVNVLPLDLAWGDGTTVSELLAAARASVLDGFRHRGVPYEAVAGARQAAGAPEPEIRATLSLEPPWEAVDRHGLRWQPRPLHNGTAKFDLGLVVRPRGDAWALLWEYDRDLFDPETVERWARSFGHGLESFVGADGEAKVAELPYLTPEERAQVLSEWARGPAPVAPPVPVHRRIVEQVRERPDAVAAVEGERHLSYGELARRSERWVRFLAGQGVGPDDRVGLVAGRTLERLVGGLAVLRAGAAYVPLDPSNPAARLSLMLREADARVTLVEAGAALSEPGVVTLAPEPPSTPAEPPGGPPPDGAGDRLPGGTDPLAYVVFTSGSTGVPKGVMVGHRGLDQLVTWHVATYGVAPGDRASVVAGPGFDASVWEVWPPLAAGATLELAPDGLLADPTGLAAWANRRRIAVAFLPTPVAEALLSGGAPDLPSLRFLLTGGDRLHEVPADPRGWTLVNHYGPSECSVVATSAPVAHGSDPGPPPIGRPLPGVAAYVVDPELRPSPPRVPGELALAGPALARGYAGRPALTADLFVPDPFGPPGSRLYRTGDLVRHRRDGSLDFLGRTDGQVEIRGHRVEPGEVEAVLARHPAVDRVAVVPVGDEPRLAAYAVPRDPEGFDPDDLGRFAARWLPPYMVPASVTVLASLPLTANGKVDRRALPAPARSSEPAAPRNEVEELVVELWRELLGVERVGIHDRFFELGGHSLMATQVVSRLGETFGIDLPVATVMRSPTPAELALDVVRALIEQSAESDVEEALSALEAGS